MTPAVRKEILQRLAAGEDPVSIACACLVSYQAVEALARQEARSAESATGTAAARPVAAPKPVKEETAAAAPRKRRARPQRAAAPAAPPPAAATAAPRETGAAEDPPTVVKGFYRWVPPGPDYDFTRHGHPTAATCQFPLGDPRDADFRFCGVADVVPGRPYCRRHCRAVYLVPRNPQQADLAARYT